MSFANNTCSSTIINPATAHRWRSYSLAHWISIAIQCYERRRERKALLELDDRMLADLGITKSQAIDEARKPLWT